MFSRINPDSDMTMYIYDCIENGEYDELNDYLNKNNIHKKCKPWDNWLGALRTILIIC